MHYKFDKNSYKFIFQYRIFSGSKGCGCIPSRNQALQLKPVFTLLKIFYFCLTWVLLRETSPDKLNFLSWQKLTLLLYEDATPQRQLVFFGFMHLFIFFTHFVLFRVTEGLEAIPVVTWVSSVGHPGEIISSSQGQHRNSGHKNLWTHTQSSSQFRSPISPTCLCGWNIEVHKGKPVHVQGAHATSRVLKTKMTDNK